MATVYAITSGSGDTYRIERVYLDRDEAYGFAEAYNGIAPVEPVQGFPFETKRTTAESGATARGNLRIV